MKRYAVLSIKDQEFIQSKNDGVYLGDKSLKIHQKVIDLLNKNDFLNNLQDGKYTYTLVETLCFDKLYIDYKITYGKKWKLKKIDYSGI